MKRLLLCLGLLFSATPTLAADAKITTVFLVRHADKNPHPAGGDAGLSAKGQLRAAELARVLGSTHLDSVYATPFGRARMTAETVARVQHDSVTVYDADHLERLAERLRALPAGSSVLVVGHADTLPGTYEALTGEAFPDKDDVPYDKLYVVLLSSAGGHRLLTLRYGAPVP